MWFVHDTAVKPDTSTLLTCSMCGVWIRAACEDFLTQNSAKIRSNLRNSEQIRSKKSGDNYVLEAPRTGKIAWSSCLQSPARLGCSILLRFHSNPPDSRAYWYKSVTNSWDFRKVVRGGSSYISPTGKLRTFWAFSECFYHLLRIRSNLRNSELNRSSDFYRPF